MQLISAKEQINFNEDYYTSETVKYCPKVGGYRVTSNLKPLYVAVLNQEEFNEYLAGRIDHIFPEYNKTKHVVNRIYSLDGSSYVGFALEISEYVSSPVNIPYGVFVFKRSDYGVFLKKIEITTDKFIDIGYDLDLYEDYKQFLSQKHLYDKMGRKHKKGVFLYGPPGNSKSYSIARLIEHAEQYKFRAFFVESDFSLSYILPYKDVLEKENSVFVLEEITERAERYGTEDLLSFLDGEMSWKNTYTIATTNHPEQLAWNLIDRPGRFKIIKKFDNPSKQQRERYFKEVGILDENIREAVDATQGMSLDYIINITSDSIFSGKSIPTVVEEYKQDRASVSNNFRKKIGL